MKRTRTGDEEETASDLVKINAGGKVYYTTQKTLTFNFPDSLLARLFTRKKNMPLDENGNFFMDVDPVLFGAILNVLRRPNLLEVVPSGVKEEIWWYELDYWGLRVYIPEGKEEEEDMIISETTKEQVMLFKAKESDMNKEIRMILAHLVGEFLGWCHFREKVEHSMAGIEAYCLIPFNHTWFVHEGKVNRWEPRDEAPKDAVEIAPLILRYAELFVSMVKQVVGVEYVAVIKEDAPDRKTYSFNGQNYFSPISHGKRDKVLRIELSHNYANMNKV